MNKEPVIKKFLEALEKAIEKGDHAFACPVCGNEAYWMRVMENGHLHSGCDGCGIMIME